MPRLFVFACVMQVLMLEPALGIAADSKKEAVTDIRLVDSDFAYQGEYLGSVWDPCCGCVPVGVQVVARGGGKFDALVCRCGLPGAGWDGATKEKLSGLLSSGSLVLHGGTLEVRTDGIAATVCDESGTTLGHLRKIERSSPTLGAAPPPEATVLFDGSQPDQLSGARITDDGLLEVGALTKLAVGDFRLHVEFRVPYMAHAGGQGRGNSGIYIQQRYEVQILDSFGAEGVENDCGALYRQQRPDLNMSLPPLAWQTYDIWFTAARWDDAGHKVANARITVLHNGVAIHCQREITGKTGAGKPESPEQLPILFQNHGNPVHFRNVWLVPDPESQTASEPGTRRCRLLRLLPRLHRRR